MALDLLKDKGTPLDQQKFTWKELTAGPYSKLDIDAMSRVRVILMNGIESDSVRFQHALNRISRQHRPVLARIRRVEHHQQTLVNWLNPADQSPLETTIGYEQVAIEVTASIAQHEPDPYMAQNYRFGLLEDFDHMYRYSALMDRVEGKDANTILQSYTDILPGRPTAFEHRDPLDDLRRPYDRKAATFLTKLHAMTLVAGEYQTHDYYMHVGPIYPDPIGRMLYAEIASIEEQHVTQYESMVDPDETLLEKWLLHEATEVYNYWSCVESETDGRLKAIWERMLDYELGHLQVVKEVFELAEGRDAAEVIDARLPAPIEYVSHRDYVREVLRAEVDFNASGPEIMPAAQIPADSPSHAYRAQLNAEGSPSTAVAAGYVWLPGTELTQRVRQEARPQATI